MKKLIGLMLCLLTIIGLTWAAAEAAPTECTCGDFEYILKEDGTAEITDCTSSANELIIPPELDGHPVTSLGRRSLNWLSCTSVTLPEGLLYISDEAFYSCLSLTTLNIPNSLATLSPTAFSFCPAPAEFNLSPSHPTLAVIDSVLFDKVERTLLFYPSSLQAETYAVPNGIRAIGDRAFCSCVLLTSITLPDSVTSIGNAAFSGCWAMTDIHFSDSVTVIGDSAFSYCRSLTAIDLPDGVTVVGASAFSDCSSLTAIDLPDSVTEIGNNAFQNCTALITINLPAGLTAIASSTFKGCTALTTISLSYGVTSINPAAFSDCSSLTAIDLPDSVTAIGNGAFYRCRSLTAIDLPNGVTKISDTAFLNCTALTTIAVVRGSYAEEWAISKGYEVTYVRPAGLPFGDLTYRVQADGTAIIVACETRASRVDVPADIDGAPVTTIGRGAFADCVTLAGVTLPASVTDIADNAFIGCGRITFTVESGSYAEAWCQSHGLRTENPVAYSWLFD